MPKRTEGVSGEAAPQPMINKEDQSSKWNGRKVRKGVTVLGIIGFAAIGYALAAGITGLAMGNNAPGFMSGTNAIIHTSVGGAAALIVLGVALYACRGRIQAHSQIRAEANKKAKREREDNRDAREAAKEAAADAKRREAEAAARAEKERRESDAAEPSPQARAVANGEIYIFGSPQPEPVAPAPQSDAQPAFVRGYELTREDERAGWMDMQEGGVMVGFYNEKTNQTIRFE